MKNKEIENFTKLTQKGGISLIVLVITIIVILILAATVIITLNNNNPIVEANTARYESDRANIQAIFTNAVAKVMTQNRATISVEAGSINTVTTGVKETTGTVNYTVTNAMNSDNSNGKIIFDKQDNTDTKFYTGKKLPIYAAGDTTWYVDTEGNISLEVAGVKYGEGEIVKPPFAKTVLDNVSTYYGELVTNYTTGNSTIDNEVDWQIFHSDGNNIYLIATDYIKNSLLPKIKLVAQDNSVTEYSLNTSGEYKAYWSGTMLAAYKGSDSITDIKLQNLNSNYYKYLSESNTTSTNQNMQAVAYMLDIDTWDTFAGEYAEYAIGGPTIELLFESYNKKYVSNGANYLTRVNSEYGYYMSKNGGTAWNDVAGLLDIEDSQYYIKSTGKANAMWIASPGINGYNTNNMIRLNNSGTLGSVTFASSLQGFRPIICLNSNVSLKEVEGGFEIFE